MNEYKEELQKEKDTLEALMIFKKEMIDCITRNATRIIEIEESNDDINERVEAVKEGLNISSIDVDIDFTKEQIELFEGLISEQSKEK